MKTKRLLCPERLRRVPHQFSWIDQRLVRDGHISRCGGPHALALYLLLVTVGDSQGLSYYSDKTAARLLGLSQAELRQARNHLFGAVSDRLPGSALPSAITGANLGQGTTNCTKRPDATH